MKEEFVRECPTNTYFVVRQEDVSTLDYYDEQAPRFLRSLLYPKETQPTYAFTAPEVVGALDAPSLAEELSSACGAQRERVSAGQSANALTGLLCSLP